MADTVFILGAGASKQAGVPLMAEFLDAARMLLQTTDLRESKESFEKVFKAIGALQAVHSKSQLDIHNIESVFAAFEMARTIGGFQAFGDGDIQTITDSMKVLIGTTIEHTLRLPMGGESVTIPQPYGQFMLFIGDLRQKASPRHTVAVITFNYDLACDFAFRWNDIRADYGLGEKLEGDSIPLLKLHGSLNWAYCHDVNKVVPLPWTDCEKSLEKQVMFRRPDQARFLRLFMTPFLPTFKYEDKYIVEPTPVIVPPTWNKTQYHQTLSAVWSRAAQELREAKNILIIGYSLPESDAFFRYLYALATVGEDPLTRFWVFNPDPDPAVEGRFTAMLGPGAAARFRWFPKNFVEAIGILKKEFRPVAR